VAERLNAAALKAAFGASPDEGSNPSPSVFAGFVTVVRTPLRPKAGPVSEAGYDVEEMLHRRGGRPPMGSAAAGVESVRLDPELSEALAQRASRDHETTSAVIREALRQYLKVA
jgi:hypothetical protein